MTKIRKEKNNIPIKKFIDKAGQMLGQYFVAYSTRIRKGICFINIIIDDRDVAKMPKRKLYNTLWKKLDKEAEKISKKIKTRTVLISDINESNVWTILGDSAEIMNVKSLIAFIGITLPKGFKETFESIPDKFKLEDFRKASKKIFVGKYHRNTYQNWLRSMERIGFVKLTGRTYYKQKGSYKHDILKTLLQ